MTLLRLLLAFLKRLFGGKTSHRRTRELRGGPPFSFPAPTIPGGRVQEVVGESRYQHHLIRIGGGKTEYGVQFSDVVAELVREPDNPDDPNAVRVDVAELTVGYIPTVEARSLHQVIAWCKEAAVRATCSAQLTGGWDRGDGDEGHIGVELYLDPTFNPGEVVPIVDGILRRQKCPSAQETAAVQLTGSRVLAVLGEQEHQYGLKKILRGAPRLETTARLVATHDNPVRPRSSEPYIVLRVAGVQVGWLSKPSTRRYWNTVKSIQDEGKYACCQCIIEAGAKKIEVQARMP